MRIAMILNRLLKVRDWTLDIAADLPPLHALPDLQYQIFPLRKHAYSNILKILQPKTDKFQVKNSNIFHISAQNIDC